MKQVSIYEKIERVIGEQGSVPHDFVLEEEPEQEAMRFAPGALEGILGHHSGAGAGDVRELAAFLKEHTGEEPEDVLECYEKEWADCRTAYVRDSILKELIGHQGEYDSGWLLELACCMMRKAARIETVKMGLTFMAAFDIRENSRMKETVIKLGCCEDFTEYVLYDLSYWPKEEQNEICFTLAQRLSGWGKINAVEKLRADTEEIREWILCSGCRNTVMYSYLGLICAHKCAYLERLRRGGLTEKELAGASDIMDGLLEEGPCRGISALENAKETVYRYLCASRAKEKNVRYLCQLLRIREYLEKDRENGDWKEKAEQELSDILASIDVRTIILQDLEKIPYDAVRAAQALDIDISDVLFGLAEKEFEKYYNLTDYFMAKRETAERFVALCEKNLDRDRIPVGMGNSLYMVDGHWPVDMTVQYLDRYPGLGEELIRVSLHSPCIRWRNMAAKALEGWKQKDAGTLRDLYGLIDEVAQQECNEMLKERWRGLLDRDL